MLLLQLALNGIIKGGIFALIALGFSVIYRGAKVFHIAHGAVFTIGAYGFYTFCRILGWNIPSAILSSLIITIFIGLATEELVYYPLYKKKASNLIVIVTSLALYMLITNLVALFYGDETQVVFTRVSEKVDIGNIILTYNQMIQLLASIIILFLSYIFMKKAKSGIVIRAISSNSMVAMTLGINIKKYRRIIFVLGSFLAYSASILISMDVGIDPWGGMSILLTGAVAMIIGGVDKLRGAVFGGFFLGFLQSIAVWKISTIWQNSITFFVLIVVLIFRTKGLLEFKKRIEEV